MVVFCEEQHGLVCYAGQKNGKNGADVSSFDVRFSKVLELIKVKLKRLVVSYYSYSVNNILNLHCGTATRCQLSFACTNLQRFFYHKLHHHSTVGKKSKPHSEVHGFQLQLLHAL